jgi:hypothetical protein
MLEAEGVQMTQRELETYCKENGIPCHMVGEKLRVMDLTQMPDHMRARFDDRGFYVEIATEVTEKEQPVGPQLRGKLPEDFPGHAALEAEGITTYAKVRKRLADLTDIPGIGDATAEKISAAMGESSEDEEEQE